MKKEAAAPPDRVVHDDRLIATIPEIERKGAANPYTSVNGNMFSYLHPSGSMALRLRLGEREKFLETYGASLMEAYGIVQKEYVRVPDDLLEHTEELQPYLEKSLAYAKTLKPKQTRN